MNLKEMNDLEAMNKLRGLPAAKLIETYIKLRDLEAQMKAQFEEQVSHPKRLRELIEGNILERLDAEGTDNISVRGLGTAYRSEKVSVTTADSVAFFTFCQEQNMFDLMEKRPSKTAVVDFMKEHGELPPGINYSSIHTVNFRRG